MGQMILMSASSVPSVPFIPHESPLFSPQLDEQQNHQGGDRALQEHEPHEDLRVGPAEILSALVVDREAVAMQEADKGYLSLGLVVGCEVLWIYRVGDI